MASWLYCIPPNLMVVQCFYYVFWLNLSNSNILDKPDAQCWPNSASLYWKLSAHHKPFCWLAHFAGWHILLFVGYQFPPQHCHSCHSYWGHFLSLLHFVTRTRLDFLDFRANSHLKVFKKNTICPIEGMFSQHVQPGMRQTLLEKGRLLQWLGAPQFTSLALSQLKRLGCAKWEVTSSRDNQGLVTVPFWVYWTSPDSSHYRPYT